MLYNRDKKKRKGKQHMSGTYNEASKKRIMKYLSKMEQINIKVPPEKKAYYKEQAEKAGMSLQGWIVKKLDS